MASDIVQVEVNPEEMVSEDVDFLKELEELAESRYTDADEDYVAAKNKGNPKPPIQQSYGGNDRGDRGQHGGSYRDRRGHHDNYNGHQRRDWSRDRRSDYGNQNNKRHYDNERHYGRY